MTKEPKTYFENKKNNKEFIVTDSLNNKIIIITHNKTEAKKIYYELYNNKIVSIF